VTELYSLFLKQRAITTDSRDCPKGSIFFALKGETFNGNAYAASALEKGCAYAVIDEAEYAADGRYIVVPDVLTTLQQLANEHRKALGTPIVGITGTNGKTTTKELVATVLGKKYNVLYTQGNFNNHIGVPKTLLQLTEEHNMAVIEMGANHPGEIKTLVNIVEPDCGLITNVGKAHLEGFGSFEGVIKTKGELYDFLREHKGKVFIDEENEHLMNISSGLNLIPYVTGEVIDCAPYLHFKWQGGDIMTHLIGAYNIKNMMAAATVGLHFGVSVADINDALAGYIPSNNRSQLTITEKNKLIVDTYNANPTSMMAALQNFSIMQVSPKMAILGDMRELGEVSEAEHKKVVDFLTAEEAKAKEGEFLVWLVGAEFSKTSCHFRKFPDVAAVKKALEEEGVPTGYHILIKGSNGIRLFELPALL
jgi:UDP-N-acetylmuramoyl-tripeptide--D-alanyl-D-alanine ligase